MVDFMRPVFGAAGEVADRFDVAAKLIGNYDLRGIKLVYQTSERASCHLHILLFLNENAESERCLTGDCVAIDQATCFEATARQGQSLMPLIGALT